MFSANMYFSFSLNIESQNMCTETNNIGTVNRYCGSYFNADPNGEGNSVVCGEKESFPMFQYETIYTCPILSILVIQLCSTVPPFNLFLNEKRLSTAIQCGALCTLSPIGN